MDAASALCEAKKSMREEKGYAPEYWAGFILIE